MGITVGDGAAARRDCERDQRQRLRVRKLLPAGRVIRRDLREGDARLLCHSDVGDDGHESILNVLLELLPALPDVHSAECAIDLRHPMKQAAGIRMRSAGACPQALQDLVVVIERDARLIRQLHGDRHDDAPPTIGDAEHAAPVSAIYSVETIGASLEAN